MKTRVLRYVMDKVLFLLKWDHIWMAGGWFGALRFPNSNCNSFSIQQLLNLAWCTYCYVFVCQDDMRAFIYDEMLFLNAQLFYDCPISYLRDIFFYWKINHKLFILPPYGSFRFNFSIKFPQFPINYLWSIKF